MGPFIWESLGGFPVLWLFNACICFSSATSPSFPWVLCILCRQEAWEMLSALLNFLLPLMSHLVVLCLMKDAVRCPGVCLLLPASTHSREAV